MKTNTNNNISLYMMLHGIIAILIGLAFIFATKELISTIIMIFGIIMLLTGVIITWKSASLKNPVDKKFKYLGFHCVL